MTEVLPDGDKAKPRTSSLLASMSLDTVTLDDALRLLTLPRTIGELDGETVTVQNGRYGPYVKKGTDSRSLDSEDQLFTLSLAEAKEMFAQPKTRGRGRAAAPPLRELGEDPDGRPIVIKDGRFGPYATDGETNASLRKGDDVRLGDPPARGGTPRRAPRRRPGQAPPPRRSRVQDRDRPFHGPLLRAPAAPAPPAPPAPSPQTRPRPAQSLPPTSGYPLMVRIAVPIRAWIRTAVRYPQK